MRTLTVAVRNRAETLFKFFDIFLTVFDSTIGSGKKVVRYTASQRPFRR